MSNEYTTAARLQQHHLSSGSANMDMCVYSKLLEGSSTILQAINALTPLAPKAANIVEREIVNFMRAATPEHRVRCISQITGALREPAFYNQRHKRGCATFLHKLAVHFVFPLLLHSSVRYLHRALATLVRTVYVVSEDLELCFQEAFVTAHIKPWFRDGCRPSLLQHLDSTELSLLKDPIMNWVNCIDGTMCVAVPLFPAVFANTFFDVVPLLGDSLQWMVDNACAGCSQSECGKGNSGMLLGEDLSYVRYGIRVVTTYVHKFLHLLGDVLHEGEEQKMAEVQEDICKLFSSSLRMLSSAVFPKDVLNGAGLLVSSLLTIRTCDASFLLEICRYCGASEVRKESNFTSVADDDGCSKRWTEEYVREFVQLVCSSDPQHEILQRSFSRDSLRRIFYSFTANGRFALMKGLLAHLSTPLRGNIGSVGVLLKPVVPLLDNLSSYAASGRPLVAVYDVIIPAAISYCSALHVPDTRFMAIQTIDSVVRHLSSVFTCIADLLETTLEESVVEGTTRVVKRGVQRAGGVGLLTETDRKALSALCANTSGLMRALSEATEVIMGMWDDSTQHVAGPLYGAYSEILAVHSSVRRCNTLLSQGSGAPNQEVDALDVAETLHVILPIPNERRGKYHALLALLDVVQVPQFLLELRQHRAKCSKEGAADYCSAVTPDDVSEVDALCEFSRMLLGGAINPKVGSAAGEVFAKTANYIRLSSGTETETEKLFFGGVIEPLLKSIVVPGYCAPLHVEDATRISNIVTHMISPCLKRDESYLPTLLSRLATMVESGDCYFRLGQSIVEILHRARVAGRDVSTYIHPRSRLFKVVLSSLQSHSSELRYTALGLCVLTMKKAEPVHYWQCRLMEWYISTNMHSGGDSAAMRNLLEVYKKWAQRLVDSCASKCSNRRRKAEGNEASDQYRELVTKHFVRTVSYIAPHIGESVEWCRNLSLERRVTAMMIYSCLLRNSTEVFTDTQLHELQEQLLPETLVEGLLECLSSGWVKARECAFGILQTYCKYAASAVFSERRLGNPVAASDAKAGLSHARTYKKAEGEVLRYVLATYFTPAARKAASEDPQRECKRRLELVKLEIAELHGKFVGLCQLGTKKAYELVKLHPFHGSLSLCAALLSNVKEVCTTADGLQESCNQMLLCCNQALQNCSLLVGGEASGSASEGDVDVDCRGHAFDKGNPCEEASMRAVVNNTWLCIRTAAAAVERVVALVSIDSLDFKVVRGVCYVLVESLLRTKHNGVMRAVRGALKTIAAALLRSRDVTCHTLPSEILEFLLGPDGVTSVSVARMLRRSQGLPHALLAVLEAEDIGVPATLFPQAMKRLLHVATNAHSNEGGPDLCPPNGNDERRTPEADGEIRRSQRSNALNVLKFIFENKSFASRSVSHLEDAFWIAASGFDDPSWGIRNSSLMLFSAVLPRFVGEHPSTGGVGVNTSLHDIAIRAPRAVAFAYEELVKSFTNPSPSLGVFPLLQMLSMLAPDPPHVITKATTVNLEGEEQEQPDSQRIVNAVVRCGSSRNLMIRAACSVALTSLVPPTNLEGLFAEFCSALSASRTAANALHGVLLHLQQFHTFYVGTLRRHVKPRALSSSVTPTVQLLVSRLTVEGLTISQGNSAQEPVLSRACVRCPTIAATFFSVASDALYHATVGMKGIEKKDITDSVRSLVNIGVSTLHSILCTATPLYSLSRAYHAAVVENITLFALLAVHYLSDITTHHGTHDALWVALRDVFACDASKIIMSHTMNHISYLMSKNWWSSEISVGVVKQFAVRMKCDLVHAALTMLRESLGDDRHVKGLSCLELLRMQSQLEFVVTMSKEGLMCLEAHSELFDAVEDLLLRRMDPSAKHFLRNADVHSWAIRFLGLRCTCHMPHNEAVLEIITHYCLPTVNVQTRLAVVDSLNDSFLAGVVTSPAAAATTSTFTKQRSVYLLVLLQLLFDDAYDVRTAACRVVSRLVLAAALPLDHTSCVIALVSLLRSYCSTGELSPVMVKQHLLKNTECCLSGSATKDTCGDDDDEGSDEEGVLFEKEADNMFAEGSLLAFLATVITREGADCVPVFSVYTELVNVSERCGNPAVMYGALLDEPSPCGA
ncbi:Putative death-receptor fusion protein (DUF2428), putative [Trypanosoma equiperdum]|uniref:Death-receptor fusion protein (DUF2428), putative n=1 Tax=Trypanosoma equiperdum TaxID=5694 RepID=A0A1G4IK21_TRYEQ|nr:Putative death-receptor fusion protein (DUF2428), putative [Trypanosoma equiperdum]